MIRFKIRLQHMWNLLLSSAIGCLGILSFYMWVSLSLDVELSGIRVTSLSHELANTRRALVLAEDRLASTSRGVDLLSDQIEITLDLLVNANRWGWFNNEVYATLARLQRLKTERKTLQ